MKDEKRSLKRNWEMHEIDKCAALKCKMLCSAVEKSKTTMN